MLTLKLCWWSTKQENQRAQIATQTMSCDMKRFGKIIFAMLYRNTFTEDNVKVLLKARLWIRKKKANIPCISGNVGIMENFTLITKSSFK